MVTRYYKVRFSFSEKYKSKYDVVLITFPIKRNVTTKSQNYININKALALPFT